MELSPSPEPAPWLLSVGKLPVRWVAALPHLPVAFLGNFLRFFFIPFLLFFVLVGVVEADWPHLRGPFYDGVSREKISRREWPANAPPVQWSRDLGQGHSGLIVANGKVYTQYQNSGGQKVLCLDPETGETVWERWYDWAWQPKGAYPGPYSTPTWHEGNIYCVSPAGVLACLNAETGTISWSFNAKERFAGKGAGFGWAAPPLVENGQVVLPVGGQDAGMVAVRAEDGKTVWAVGSDPASYCGAFPLDFQGQRCVVGYLENALVLHDLKTGKLLHRTPLSQGYDEHSAWPLYREPFLMLMAPFRAPAIRYELQAKPENEVTTRIDWMCRQFANDVVSSVLINDLVFGFDLKQIQSSIHRSSRGTFRCLDWKTGRVRWSTEEVGHAAVLANEEHLFLLNDTGTLVIAKVNADAYEEVVRWEIFADETCWTPPTLWRDRLFLRSPKRCVCLNLGDEKKETSQPRKSVGIAFPSMGIDLRWMLGRERDFPNDAFTWEELATWYYASAVGVASLAAVAACGCCLVRIPQALRLSNTTLFWMMVFLFGLLGASIGSLWFQQCLLTWPASLYAMFHGVCVLGWRAHVAKVSVEKAWLARFAMAGFVLLGFGYFELCKATGMFIAWVFLAGFPLAFPFTVLAVWMAEARRWYALSLVLELGAFTVYFWACPALLWWKG